MNVAAVRGDVFVFGAWPVLYGPAMDFVCTQCGLRQAEPERCAGCGDDTLLDLREERTRELLVEMDARRRDRRETQVRILAVVIGIATVAALWLVPGYWGFRERNYAMPFLIDQWALMIGIAFGAMKLVGKALPARRRFPFVDG